jgi:hypothetical protein
MPNYFATAFFQCNELGWTETYYRDGGGTTDLAVLADFDRTTIWQKRANCLALPSKIVAQRVSFDTVLGDSVLNYIEMAGNAAFDSEDPSTAVLVRLGNADNTKRKNVFFRGCSDAAIISGGKFTGPGRTAIQGAFDSFFGALIANNYGWKGSDTKVDMDVTGWTFDTQNRIVFAVDPTNFPVLADGVKVTWRGKDMGAGRPSKLNRPIALFNVGNNTVRTTKPTAAFPYPGVGPKFTRRTYALRVAMNARYQKVSTRKAGKNSHVQAGRLRAQPLG